jgi:hypothetical protein
MKNYLLNKSPKPHARLMHALQAQRVPGINKPGLRVIHRKGLRQNITGPSDYTQVFGGNRSGKTAAIQDAINEARRQGKRVHVLEVPRNETPEETVRRISKELAKK